MSSPLLVRLAENRRIQARESLTTGNTRTNSPDGGRLRAAPSKFFLDGSTTNECTIAHTYVEDLDMLPTCGRCLFTLRGVGFERFMRTRPVSPVRLAYGGDARCGGDHLRATDDLRAKRREECVPGGRGRPGDADEDGLSDPESGGPRDSRGSEPAGRTRTPRGHVAERAGGREECP